MEPEELIEEIQEFPATVRCGFCGCGSHRRIE
jgi:hypothetical protein